LNIIKRDGKIVKFNQDKIVRAIEMAMRETKNGIDSKLSVRIANKIEDSLKENSKDMTVEEVSDMVAQRLMASSRKDVATAYIEYRVLRGHRTKTSSKFLTDEFISKYKHRESPMNPLGQFVYLRTYSRWLEEEKRREYWWETVRRAVEYNCSLIDRTTRKEAEELFDSIYNLNQFLSGRTFWVGGTPIGFEYGTSNYNCAFTVIDEFQKFKELFYLLMVGSGVGFRVLKSDVVKLPEIRTNVQIFNKDFMGVLKSQREEYTSVVFTKDVAKIIIGDSKEGWTQALDWYFRLLTEHDYKNIKSIILNYDNIRPLGEKLKRFGGTASGHNSLKNMFEKITKMLYRLDEESGSHSNKLRPIHCMDICNMIGENVVVGGVRRTAEVGLIDSDDLECIQAKNGIYTQNENGEYVANQDLVHRFMSNNTIIYYQKPTFEQIKWQIEQMRYSGEPGFMNMEAARKRRPDCEGGNPCMEILLGDRGLCNLTTINVMAFVKDKVLDLEALIEAQIRSVRAGVRMTCLKLELHKWNMVQMRDRLLGCSFTGFRDAMDVLGYTKEQEDELYDLLKSEAHRAAQSYSKELDIPTPLLVTTIKPEGTLSLLAGVSNGIHYAHSPYYIRRVRINASDPLVKACEELGYPVFPENGQDIETCTTKVIEFPVKSPSTITKYDVSAIEQLENYKRVMEHYVDHNASITITVRNDEWEDVTKWVYENWDSMVAVSFLSLDDSFYDLMPYETIDETEYNKRFAEMKPFIPSLLAKYETQETELDIGDSECVGGVCPIR